MMFMLLLYITFLLHTISVANSHKYWYSLHRIRTCFSKSSPVHVGLQAEQFALCFGASPRVGFRAQPGAPPAFFQTCSSSRPASSTLAAPHGRQGPFGDPQPRIPPTPLGTSLSLVSRESEGSQGDHMGIRRHPSCNTLGGAPPLQLWDLLFQEKTVCSFFHEAGVCLLTWRVLSGFQTVLSLLRRPCSAAPA